MNAIVHRDYVGLAATCLATPLTLAGPSGAGSGVACAAGQGSCKMPQCAAGETCDKASGRCLRDGQPSGGNCGDTCLDKVQCEASDEPFNPTEEPVPIAKCPRSLFLQPELAKHECGDSCPCWRVVPRDACAARANVSPFAFEVMRKTRAPFGVRTRASCRVSTKPWDDPSVQQAAVHCVAR